MNEHVELVQSHEREQTGDDENDGLGRDGRFGLLREFCLAQFSDK